MGKGKVLIYCTRRNPSLCCSCRLFSSGLLGRPSQLRPFLPPVRLLFARPWTGLQPSHRLLPEEVPPLQPAIPHGGEGGDLPQGLDFLQATHGGSKEKVGQVIYYHSFSLNKILFPAGPLRSTSRLALAAAPTPWPLNTSLSCRTLPWRTFTATTDLTSWHWDTTLGISSRTGRGWTRETLTCDHPLNVVDISSSIF